MLAAPLVPGGKIRVIAAARATGIREDQRAFLVIHEGLRLREVCGAGAVLDNEALAATICGRLADDPARAAGDLGHRVGAEALDDLVQRARDRRQAGQLLDEGIAARNRFPRFHRLAVAEYGAGRHVAVAIGEGLIELHRKGMGEVIEDIFPRGDVNAHV